MSHNLSSFMEKVFKIKGNNAFFWYLFPFWKILCAYEDTRYIYVFHFLVSCIMVSILSWSEQVSEFIIPL